MTQAAPKIAIGKAKLFSQRVLAWYYQAGRHDLPWQQDINPYKVWVSEIMLQQTQVNTVIPYYHAFMQAFPDVHALAAAEQAQVLQYWSGLGYYARARNLHKAAQILVSEYGRQFPQTLEQWQALPGIGRSTAGAILALSMAQRQPIMDGNVKRVLCRYHAIGEQTHLSATQKQLWDLAEQYTPDEEVGAYTQAMMDLGATVCRRSQPTCLYCPLSEDCKARQQGNPTAYPVSKKRAPLPTQARQLWLIQNPAGEILLQKRPQTGIWGGLWSLPECEEGDCAYQSLAGEHKQGKAFRHTFTHYHLAISPRYLQLANPEQIKLASSRWFALDAALAEGLPKPVRSLLLRLNA